MELNAKLSSKPKYGNRKEIKTVYSPCQITKNIILPMKGIGQNLNQTLENTISRMIDGKCIVEGYVKPGSIKIITYSSGIVKGENIHFTVVFNCEVCFPVAGINLNCIAKNITKAGIRAESSEETPSPFIMFIARDHYFSSEYFNSIKENENFTARVIAQRFELNDKYVSVIGELVFSQKDNKKESKPRLVM